MIASGEGETEPGEGAQFAVAQDGVRVRAGEGENERAGEEKTDRDGVG